MKLRISNVQNDDFNQAIQPYAQIVLTELAEKLGLEPEVRGDEMTLLNPRRSDNHTGSFSINLTTGKYFDHAHPEHKGHNFLNFISHISGKNPEEITAELKPRLEALNSETGSEELNKLDKQKGTPPLIPVGPSSILPPDIHPDLGRPTDRWQYNTVDGKVCFYIFRFDTANGKEFRPVSFDGSQWHWKSWPDNRPLYHADLLADNPDQTVIIVEGEKACDAAAEMFPDYICTTSCGGSAAPKKTDWTILHGRDIIIIPDNDPAGFKYRDRIIENLHSKCSIQIVETGSLGWEKGDDLANHPMTADEASQWLKENIQGLDEKDSPDTTTESVPAADKLVSLVTTRVEKHEFELFRDNDDLYLGILKPMYKNYLLDSAKTSEILSHLYYSTYKKGLTENAHKTALATLKAMARFDGVNKKVYRRVARPDNNKIVIDLGRDDWSVIEITPEQWEYKKHSSVPFTRYEGQMAMPVPAQPGKGDVEVLRKLINVHPEDFSLFIGIVLSALSGRPPFPVAAVVGLFGSGKTTLSSMLKQIIDPCVDLLASPPETPTDLYAGIHHSWFTAFDNVSVIGIAMSDAICRASTGGHATRRKLHTTFEKSTVDVTRPLLLNCITNPIRRPDLLSRTVFLHTIPLRSYAKDLNVEFNNVWPTALSGILNALSAGLKHQHQTTGMNDHRLMACFHWITACEYSLPWQKRTFYQCFMAQSRLKDEDALDDSLVGGLLVEYMTDRMDWAGTAAELLKILREMESAVHVLRDPDFPSNPNWLTRKLNDIIPNLESIGLKVCTDIRTTYINYKDEKKRDRHIKVEWINQPSQHTVDDESEPDNKNHPVKTSESAETIAPSIPNTPPFTLESCGDNVAINTVLPQNHLSCGDKKSIATLSPQPQSHVLTGLQTCGDSSVKNISLIDTSTITDSTHTNNTIKSNPNTHITLGTKDLKVGKDNIEISNKRLISTSTNIEEDDSSIKTLQNVATVATMPTAHTAHSLEVCGDTVAIKNLMPQLEYEVIRDEDLAIQTIGELVSQCALLGLDIETKRRAGYLDDQKAGLHPQKGSIRLIQIYTGDKGYIFDLDKINIKIFKALSQIPCIAHNALFEATFFQAAGIELKLGCTMLMHAVLNAEPRISLKAASKQYLDVDISKLQQLSDWNAPDLSKEQLDYAMLDAVLAFKLFKVLHRRLADEKLLAGYKLARDCINPVAKTQVSGIPFDQNKHLEIIAEWKKDSKKAKTDLIAHCGDINFNSQKQLSEWLRANLPEKELSHWKQSPKSGHLSTNAEELARHADVELVKPLLAYKALEKQITTYGEGYRKHIVKSRIHPSFTILGAASGRMTCREPNVQQMPNKYGLRECLKAPQGYLILTADYSQIELRIAAILANDQTMLEAYRHEQDLHTLMASKILHKPELEISREDRKVAKAANFGLLYGAGAATLRRYAKTSYGVDLSLSEAERIKTIFQQTYSGIYRWQQETTAQTAQSLITRTQGGRIRRYKPEENGLYCESLNTPVQGAGADLIMLTIPLVDVAITDTAAEIISFVHDEIVLQVPEYKVETVRGKVEENMQAAFINLFPDYAWMAKNIVESSSGRSYANAK